MRGCSDVIVLEFQVSLSLMQHEVNYLREEDKDSKYVSFPKFHMM